MGRKEAGAKNNRLSHGAALGGVKPTEPELKNPGRGGGEKSIFPSDSHVCARGSLFPSERHEEGGGICGMEYVKYVVECVFISNTRRRVQLMPLFPPRNPLGGRKLPKLPEKGFLSPWPAPLNEITAASSLRELLLERLLTLIINH